MNRGGAPDAAPPSRPVSAIVRSPSAVAATSAATTFGEAPLVLRPSATSPLRPSASTCRAKMRSYA